MIISAEPMASGAKLPMLPGSTTLMPTLRTRKNVPMNSTRYFFISKNLPQCGRKLMQARFGLRAEKQTGADRSALLNFFVAASRQSAAFSFSISGALPRRRYKLYVVSAGRCCAAATGPVRVKEFAARLVHALVSVRAEIIALRLEQVCRQNGAAVLVVERQRGAERGHRNSLLRRRRHDVAPAFLRALDFAPEIIVEQQVRELRIIIVGFLDLAEETRADDAAAAPHQRDAAVVQRPAVFLGCRAHQHITLRIADDFRGVKRVADAGDELFFLFGIRSYAREGGTRAFQFLRRFDAFIFQRRNAAGINR